MSAQPWTSKNRLARALANADVRVGPSPSGGRGLFTTRPLSPGDPACSYRGGTEISRARLAELHASDRALFERVNEYAVATPSGGHLYAPDLGAVGAHLINHSCGPNVRWAEWERGSLVVRALKRIPVGEELTVHYGWLGVKAAHDRLWHECRCGARLCAGTVELRLEWLEDPEDPNVIGTSLPVDEAARRFAADIVNATDRHEALLRDYAANVGEMLIGSTEKRAFDWTVYARKLQAGARAALDLCAPLADRFGPESMRRMVQIAERYQLNIPIPPPSNKLEVIP